MFDPLKTPIPKLREDLELVPYKDEGGEYLILRDPIGYGRDVLIFRPEALMLLQLFDGELSVQNLRDELLKNAKIKISEEQILEIVQTLDSYLFLDNERFRTAREAEDAEYLKQSVRKSAHAGQAYPADPIELKKYFHELFSIDATKVQTDRIAGIIVPHIDLQVAPGIYVPSFKYLLKADFDTVVILGTCHYSDEDLFILTEKDFETPFGILPTDKDFIRLLHEKSDHIFTKRDIAHRYEHSIEFPVLFLQYLYGNEKVKIVPILCSSFEEYLTKGIRMNSIQRYQTFLSSFREVVSSLDRRIVFILSIDWSHIGRKFGDNIAASEILPTVRETDTKQIEALEHVDYEQFYYLLNISGNASRIDGFSCITTFLDLAKPDAGKLLSYAQWHEEEKESGVTFASMVFFSNHKKI